jgi:hypothetical protein
MDASSRCARASDRRMGPARRRFSESDVWNIDLPAVEGHSLPQQHGLGLRSREISHEGSAWSIGGCASPFQPRPARFRSARAANATRPTTQACAFNQSAHSEVGTLLGRLYRSAISISSRGRSGRPLRGSSGPRDTRRASRTNRSHVASQFSGSGPYSWSRLALQGPHPIVGLLAPTGWSKGQQDCWMQQS